MNNKLAKRHVKVCGPTQEKAVKPANEAVREEKDDSQYLSPRMALRLLTSYLDSFVS